MGTFIRGIKNAFRNGIRTGSIVVILGLSIGLALVMLIALTTVQSKIASVKSSIGNTIAISPAGFNPGSDANNALTTESVNKIKSLPHITNVTENLTSRVTTEGTTSGFGRFGGQSDDTNNTTNLTSPVDLSQVNKRGGNLRIFTNGGGSSLPANFSLPITVLGTTDPGKLDNGTATLKDGKTIDGSKDTNDALVSTDLASKNNLKVGSTFTAYGATLTVVGIYDSGTKGGNNTIILSLPTVQRLSGNSDEVSNATATVDSLENLSSATDAVKNSLGSDNADVTSSQDQANAALQPLQNIQAVSLYSLVGALVAGAVIIFLTMLMIVRERRREIGVLKAIGASNISIVAQFMSEATTFTLLGSVVGIVLGLLLSNPILHALAASGSAVSTTASAAQSFSRRGGGGFGGEFGRAAQFGANQAGDTFRGAQSALQNLHASFGYEMLLYGLLAAIVIAIVGSAIPAWLTAKVRPAEVMRGE